MTIGSVPIAAADAGTSEVLREAADQANGRRRAERRQIVVIDLVAQAGVTNLVQAHELVEAVAAPVRHEQSMEGHGEARLPERLHGLRLAQDLAPAGTSTCRPVWE